MNGKEMWACHAIAEGKNNTLIVIMPDGDIGQIVRFWPLDAWQTRFGADIMTMIDCHMVYREFDMYDPLLVIPDE